MNGPRGRIEEGGSRAGRMLVAQNGARIFGGAERYVVRLLARLQERGHRVLFLCRDEDIAAQAHTFGVPAEVARLGGHASLHHAVLFAERLRRLRPDGLLLSTFKKSWLGAMGARMAGVPRVIARIGLETDLPGRSPFYRIAFRRWIDEVVVNARSLHAPVVASLPGLSPERVHIVLNGVEVPQATAPRGALRRKLGIPPEVPVVGTVARLASQKRLDLLLRAVAQIEGLRCVIAGDGPERPELAALIAELGIDERVFMLGHRESVGDVLDALDLFAITSRTEGMSNAMLEALAAGVPVLSTAVSGAAEALEPMADGQSPGRVVEADLEGITGALTGLLADRAGLAQMGIAARERARARYAWEDKVTRWEALFAGGRRAGR